MPLYELKDKILLIDEFHFSRHTKYKYPAILMNFENNLIIDIIESKIHDIMSDYWYYVKISDYINVRN